MEQKKEMEKMLKGIEEEIEKIKGDEKSLQDAESRINVLEEEARKLRKEISSEKSTH